MKPIFTLLIAAFLCSSLLSAQGLTIQENETGFCSIDGIVDTDVSGYTGDGFLNGVSGSGTSALWNISVSSAGTYHIYWRYANGGGAGDLIAELWVNESPLITDYAFTHTGSWTNWTESDTVAVNLQAGENRIRLVSVSPNGLTNLDYFHVIEDNVQGAACVPSYSLSLSQNFAEGGAVSYNPVQPFYDAGAEITLTAQTHPGYFFQSWSGGETGVDTVHTFKIQRNADVEALFYPEGTQAPEGIYGYATVQDDEGTPYLMTGGRFGDTVMANSFASLKSYLESDQPYVIHLADHFINTGTINIKSDKTLIGVTDSAHLEGIRIKINDADNIILKNVTFSKVVTYDAIEINRAHHVWIDSCEFFSDLDHDKDYYDGLLDIKNAARFITVSNTQFHDHYKAVLISSGDDSFQDTSIRITFHHNFFHYLGSRTPLMRFGKAHIFNNYYRNCSSGINSRMGACLRVEKNYFYTVNKATRTDMSAEVGYFQLIDNIFELSGYVTDPTCVLDVPYEYQSILDDPADIPMIVAGEDPLSSVFQPGLLDVGLTVYPNPASDLVRVEFDYPGQTRGSLVLYDLTGRKVRELSEGMIQKGKNQLSFSVAEQPAGIYFLRLQTAAGVAVQRLVVK